MKVVYVILKDGEYTEVSKEEYDSFEGEKFFGPPFWRMIIVQEWLIQLRWNR